MCIPECDRPSGLTIAELGNTLIGEEYHTVRRIFQELQDTSIVSSSKNNEVYDWFTKWLQNNKPLAKNTRTRVRPKTNRKETHA